MKINGLFNKDNIFLIDGSGAALSFLFLISLTIFAGFSGMPDIYLILLSFLAAVFTIYSLCCHFLKPEKWKTFLAIIITCNLLYCLLTGISMYRNADKLTLPGFILFGGEILIIITLVGFELNVLRSKE